MKILYCIAGTYNSGGMERVLANKANYLVQRGYEVIIATSDQQGRRPFFALDERIRCFDLGINYEENNGKSLWNKLLHYPFKQWRHRRRMTTLLAQERPDIVISMYCNEASFIPKLKDGSKKILEIHFSKFKRLQYGRKGLWGVIDGVRSRLDERLVRRYDRFIVLTEEDKGYWGELPNIEVIPNARTFVPTQTASLEQKTALAIGRYSHQKGFDRLIDAWQMVAQAHPDWQLRIVGNGEDRKQLEEQIARLNLQSSIRLEAPKADVADFYLNASLYILSSRYEGLPMVLLEAQAYGLPIVAYACKCGPRDIISDGVDGFLVEEGNIEELAAHIKHLIEQDAMRKQMGKEAAKASARFGEERIMQQWINLFERL